jgi:protocatechuate 4,5-dioxygenase alpha chain
MASHHVAREIESISAIIEFAKPPRGHAAGPPFKDLLRMSAPRDYEDIPGTYVYDAERGRIGYALNMFCMSLNKPANRVAFKANEAQYLDKFQLTPEQRAAVLKRDWLGMLKVGGNIYYTIKIAFCDGLTFQDVAGMMCGMPRDEYAKMMLAGGRSPTGNLFKDGA